MKKTTAFARKRRRLGLSTDPSVLKGTHYLKPLTAIASVQPYDENEADGLGAMNIQTWTAHLADVRVHFERLKGGALKQQDIDAHDQLCHVLGTCQVRTLEIGGQNANAAMAIFNAASDALKRTRERWQQTSRWGLDGPAIHELADFIDLYEVILRGSSPRQMETAYERHLDRLSK